MSLSCIACRHLWHHRCALALSASSAEALLHTQPSPRPTGPSASQTPEELLPVWQEISGVVERRKKAARCRQAAPDTYAQLGWAISFP